MPSHQASFTGEWSSGTTFDVTTTISSGSDRYAYCYVSIGSASITADAVAWDPATLNEAFTEVQETVQSNCRCSYWELINPSAGTSLPTRVTISGSGVNDACASVSEYTSVHQTTARDSLFSATYTGTNTATVDVTDSASDDLVVDGNGAFFPTGRTWTVGASQTERAKLVASNDRQHVMASDEAGSASTVTMSWDASAGGGSRNGVIMATSLNPVAAGDPEGPIVKGKLIRGGILVGGRLVGKC